MVQDVSKQCTKVPQNKKQTLCPRSVDAHPSRASIAKRFCNPQARACVRVCHLAEFITQRTTGIMSRDRATMLCIISHSNVAPAIGGSDSTTNTCRRDIKIRERKHTFPGQISNLRGSDWNVRGNGCHAPISMSPREGVNERRGFSQTNDHHHTPLSMVLCLASALTNPARQLDQMVIPVHASRAVPPTEDDKSS